MAADRLLDLLAKHDLEMTLPAGIPTLEALSTGNFTRVDNVFCTSTMAERTIRCDTDPGLRPTKTDHFPIVTTLDIRAPLVSSEERLNWKTVKWKELCERLEEDLRLIGEPKEIESKEEFWERLRQVNRVIEDVLRDRDIVALTADSPHQRRWWNKELGRLRQDTARLSRKHYRRRHWFDHPIHELYREVKNYFAAEIKKAKTAKWLEWLELAEGDTIWDIGKMLEGGPSD
ncbi:hypothetical protein K435DRAFT_701710, partial [Dendrothele bispora CBS 962.96]